jgi:hypothetical protein
MTSRLSGAAWAALLAAAAPALLAQPAIEAQSSSTITYGVKNGEKTVEIRNVAYEVSGTGVPGRPPDQRLVLRQTARSKEVLGEKGADATMTLEAWPLGANLNQKPLYAITLTGVEARTTDHALWVVARGTEEVEWWSVHKLGNGQKLFDTYVPLVRFSLSREVQTLRYAGFEAPPDDTPDARLKEPHVIGVLTYASAERVIREALLTCDDRQRAQVLRSYWDTTRTVSLVDQAGAPSPGLRISFRESAPAAGDAVTVLIGIAGDDLDLARAQLPASLHARPWRR